MGPQLYPYFALPCNILVCTYFGVLLYLVVVHQPQMTSKYSNICAAKLLVLIGAHEEE